MKLIILLLTIPFFIKAQNIKGFYKQINIATNLAKCNQKDSAIIVFEDAFNKVNYVNTIYLKSILALSKEVKDKERIRK